MVSPIYGVSVGANFTCCPCTRCKSSSRSICLDLGLLTIFSGGPTFFVAMVDVVLMQRVYNLYQRSKTGISTLSKLFCAHSIAPSKRKELWECRTQVGKL